MHIHILGICGTLMGGIARLACEAGHRVSGSDANVYPPMSTQLAALGVDVKPGYRPEHLDPAPDCVIIGNALSRGNPAVEYVLDRGIDYVSGPQWLAAHILHGRWVLAVAGTHGKTTTSAMLAWILEHAGLHPGFLIGGVPHNFGTTARLGSAPFFVVEADEYDSAFFDKRSKFVHYRPRTAILNNLEFDHADIFADLAAIEQQFHHFVRTLPATGLIVAPVHDSALARVLARGCWTPVEPIADAAGWEALSDADDGSFDIHWRGERQGRLHWPLLGEHNRLNALAAIAAARHAGVAPALAIEALQAFKGVQRRLELRGEIGGIAVYDDFAHHPTAITTTLAGLRRKVGSARILAVLEPRSNTMRLGVHQHSLAPALAGADSVLLYAPPDLGWDLSTVTEALGSKGQAYSSIEAIIDALLLQARPGDHILIMSNGGFGGLHERLIQSLQQRATA